MYTHWEGRHKLFLFIDDMNIYVDVENPEKLTKKKPLLELISDTVSLQNMRLINKSRLLSYIPTINKWNLKLKVQYHLY